MSVEIVVFNPLGSLAPEIVDDVRAGIEDGVAAFNRRMTVERVGIAVHHFGYVSEFTGLGGMNYGPEGFSLFVDDTYAALKVNTRANAASVAVHELHHALRQRIVPMPRHDSCTAGDALVLEGLATQTEHFLGYGEPLNVRGIDLDTVAPLIAKIEPIIDNPKAAWGWIYELNGLPPQIYKAMYPMGHHIVAPFLESRRCSPIEAMNVPWRDIWTCFKARSQ